MTFTITTVPTAPIEGQKTGTSGLRKKVTVFQSKHYLHNWVQSLFSALPAASLAGSTLAVGGDGRYFNDKAIRIIARIAAANGVKTLLVGHNGILCTPAISAVIRARKILGGIILTASHNPGGPTEDFGIKYNGDNGGPAQESLTDMIYENTKSISSFKIAGASDADEDDPFAAVDLAQIGDTTFGDFTLSVISSTDDYVALLSSMFDFPALKSLLARPDFSILFDAMSGVTGPYARRILVEELGAPESALMRAVPLEDFGGGHPDPNLTYAKQLVDRCFAPEAPAMGAASDGDGDRNMILGNNFFVTPSDSVAVIAAYAAKGAIPYFKAKGGLKGIARSMPTAGATDRVAAKLGLEHFETPTGWKFFGNLMDAGRVQVCGEESFGTGSDHVREKDGIFAVLCWLQILAFENADASKPLVTIESIVTAFWKEYGRNYFSRYDYETVETDAAMAMMAHVAAVQDGLNAAKDADGKMALGDFPIKVVVADDFEYTDPVDGSVAKGQGKRFVFEDHSRIVFRLSGTGSSGATIRMYVEKYEAEEAKQKEDAQIALKPFIDLALATSKLQEFTGREKPTVIT